MTSSGNVPRRYEKFAVGGLLGTCMAAMLVILSISPLTVSLKIAVLCFSFAIPVLAVFMLKDVFFPSDEIPRIPWFAGSVFGLALKAGPIGIACLFFHVWWIAGVIYCVMTIFAWILLITYTGSKTDWNKEAEQ